MAEEGGKHNVDMSKFPDDWTVEEANAWIESCAEDVKADGNTKQQAISICKAQAEETENFSKPS